MRELVKRLAGLEHLDYTQLLIETNVFGRGKNLRRDHSALDALREMMSLVESDCDYQAARRVLQGEPLCSPEDMKVGCELEWETFFSRGRFESLLYIGSGACPAIALFVLKRDSKIVIDGIDIAPEATNLCLQLAARMGLRERLCPSTQDALTLSPDQIKAYDSFFISSAVRPKNEIILRLLEHKRNGAKIYGREDESHPDFYELVTVRHPDLLAAREARSIWLREKGTRYPMPAGCELS